ncbi:MAG: hypothetical protein ABR587_16035, partial [Candidatus Binatia bacterium]
MIAKNRFFDTEDSEAVRLNQTPGCRVESNKFERVNSGIAVYGSNSGFVVAKNRIRAGTGEAIRIHCAGCTGSVFRNRVLWAGDDADGIYVFSGPGTNVSNNTVMAASDDGFEIDGDGMIVTDNKATNFG